MKKILYTLMLLVAAYAVASCIYDFEPNVEGNGGFIVIEGDILIGEITEVSVTLSTSLKEKEDQGYLNATSSVKVWVESDDGTTYQGFYKYDNTNDRPYFVVDTRNASENSKYRMVVDCTSNGRGKYVSSWKSVLKTSEIDSVTYSINDTKTVMAIKVSTTNPNGEAYYKWIGKEDWEYHANYFATHYFVRAPGVNTRYLDTIVAYENGENSYYCWNRGKVSDVMIASTEALAENRLVDYQLYEMTRDEMRISYIYSVKLIQESISEESYKYWNSIQKNSGQVGGLFASEPFEMRGNIVNELDENELVLGYIDAAVPSSKRIFIYSSRLGFGRNPRYPAEPQTFSQLTWRNRYDQGFRVFSEKLDEITGEPTGDYEWLPRYCIECTYYGGDKKKPDFWPNDDI